MARSSQILLTAYLLIEDKEENKYFVSGMSTKREERKHIILLDKTSELTNKQIFNPNIFFTLTNDRSLN